MNRSGLRVLAGSRLHFGMLSFGQRGMRQFGGAGVMISSAALQLRIEESDSFSTSGPMADRVEQFVMHLSRHADWWQANRPFRVTVETAPPPHAGLGSGTQLGMALAMALAGWFDAGPQTAEALARSVGRGKRSAVGVHGACSGGFIIEGGKLADDEISPLVSRIAMPEEWRFLLITPSEAAGISGEVEQQAFQRLPPAPLEITAALCRELVCELAPSVSCGDFDRFGQSLYRYGQLAGECFAAWQGGLYASPAIERLVTRCREAGARGVGQSSWGPTVFALCPSQRDAEQLRDVLQASGELKQATTSIATSDNRGIQISTLSS
ncbi:MAG: beta-ribofuranosylaminobenzene 5'-phosphate synthase [Pirellulales bacterium]